MTSDLHAQLHDLAADAPVPVPPDAGALWRAGRRRQSRRAAAGALAATAVVLAGIGGAGTVLPHDGGRDVPPATTSGVGALPDRLYVPGRWTESNDDDPVGPMAALLSTNLGWHDATGYVGVSAATGEYRAIRLPGSALAPGSGTRPGVAEALSPSGRYVAYWLTGVPAGRAVDNQLGKPVVGVAVYDTVTTRVGRSVLQTEHGVVPESLLWSDDDTLYFQVSQIDKGHPGGYAAHLDGQGRTVTIGEDQRLVPGRVRIPGLERYATAIASDHRGRLLFDPAGVGRSTTMAIARPVGAPHLVERRRPSSLLLDVGGALAADGSIAALTRTPDERQPSTVSIAAPGRAAREVPGAEALRFWALTDRGAVVDLTRSDRTGDYLPTELARVAPSGAVTTLTDYPRWDGRIQVEGFAADLMDLPSVHRDAPATPRDPRVLPAVAGAALALLGVALLLRRRRVRD
ncbi:hypothetical protein [Nocardioides jiangxiensis]|uniref:Uncharacterized protein n=1 Tax=Nocardioides jiangxiensis TaxID=3064524 RepID=A0ABT9B3X9_9ACTN|nr:hypothetical protein [Nocardioides sp. WY-20]MDO7869485.1 hypothetical protein [Nocardioides sp. WY-20]